MYFVEGAEFVVIVGSESVEREDEDVKLMDVERTTAHRRRGA